MGCVSPEQWLALTEARLSRDEELDLRTHAAACATCGPQLAVHDEKHRLAREAPTQALAQDQLPKATGPLPSLERGTSVGRFVIIDVLGVGGMGAVYSAYDPNLDRRVAIKTLHVGTTGDATAHTRMLREAQAMARLNHPNVVNVFEVGEHHGGIFIAMEYVPGVTLRLWVREKERTWREVVAAFAQAGRGLAAAHAAHLVHRDFKPANVLLGDDGRARVTDFGVARADGSLEPVGHIPRAANPEDSGTLTSGSFSEPLTRGDVVVGTVGYMSPEQAAAKPPDARSDQFSFCICLWEALYGARPFTGKTVADVTRAVLEAPLPPRPRTDVPAWLHAVLVRGLEKDPARRYPSMTALLKDLERTPDDWKRKAVPWAAAGAVLLVLGGLQLAARVQAKSRCDAVNAELAGVWDDGVYARVATAFGAIGKPFTSAALASVQRAFDGYAREWSQAARDACEAQGRGELSDETFTLTRACLSQRKDELGSLVAVLAAADEGVVERAGTLAWGLSPIKACSQAARLKADPRLLDPRRAEQGVVALKQTLTRARPLIDAGKLKDAGPLVESAIKDARALERRALEAEALSLQASLQMAAGKYADAVDTWTQVAMAAQASGFDELLALAAIRLTTLVGFHQNRPKDGRVWDALARATIERLGGDDLLVLERMSAIARLGSAEGKALEVATQSRAALELANKLLGDSHPVIWRFESELGNSLVWAKDYAEAAQHLERALALREKEVSADHPEVATVRSALANAYFFVGRAAESRAAFTQALSTREKLFGVDSPRLVVTLNNFGDTLVKSGRLVEGQALLARAVKLAQTNFPPSHPYTAATITTLAGAQLALGEKEQARAGLDQVLATQPPPLAAVLAETAALRAQLALGDGKPKDALGFAERGVKAAREVAPRSAELLLPLLALGEAQLATGDAGGAVKTLEDALALADETKPWRVYDAHVRFALARARRGAKQPDEQVLPLAKAALETYRQAEGQQARAEAAERFLSLR